MSGGQRRQAIGAGRWFPAAESQLRSAVDRYLAAASPISEQVLATPVLGVVSPHAGYEYSGKVSGYSFRALRESAVRHGEPNYVVIVGFSHSGSFPGAAIMPGTEFVSPIGTSPLANDVAEKMCLNRPKLKMNYGPHHGEHSAENQIPFVQAIFPHARLVVVLLGDHAAATINQLVDALVELRTTSFGGPFVVVSSSDMLHDADYDKVVSTDHHTLELVTRLDDAALASTWNYSHQILCGIGPVLVLVKFAKACGPSMRAHTLHYRNCGDDFPESKGDWVVGYGAVAFS
ncbi:AmmeMemoRadiSam system protein B [Pelomyxa schiedti]|nr:AmmeMemoRadiSam system protein B [Pelomyxa schiedti]